MRVVTWTGGEFDGLHLECEDDVDIETFIENVRSAMYFTAKIPPPEIRNARRLMGKKIYAPGENRVK